MQTDFEVRKVRVLSAISWFFYIPERSFPQNLVAVAYNNRPHYYFGKVVEEVKGEAVKISFLWQLSTNKYCWPNEPVTESVGVEQIFQRNIKAEVLEERNTFAFPVIQDITTKLSQMQRKAKNGKKESCSMFMWQFTISITRRKKNKVLNCLLQ